MQSGSHYSNTLVNFGILRRFAQLISFRALPRYSLWNHILLLRCSPVSRGSAMYSATHRQPEIYRLLFGWDWARKRFQADVNAEVQRGKYNVVFGGQYDVIQRVVNGIDVHSWLNLKTRCREVLEIYRDKVQADLTAHGYPLSVIPPDPNDSELDLFSKKFGGVTGIFADTSDLSEQAGIDFVRFLITTMIKAQEFSSSMPTVGGEIHLAVITKKSGFQWVAKPYLERAGDTPDS
jgi:hypothetical protein